MKSDNASFGAQPTKVEVYCRLSEFHTTRCARQREKISQRGFSLNQPGFLFNQMGPVLTIVKCPAALPQMRTRGISFDTFSIET